MLMQINRAVISPPVTVASTGAPSQARRGSDRNNTTDDEHQQGFDASLE
jgi:hypothetical protein